MNPSMLKEADQIIYIPNCQPSSRKNHRLTCGRNLFQQWPIFSRATRHLNNIEIHFTNNIDGIFIKWGTDGDHPLRPDFIKKNLVLVPKQTGRYKALNLLMFTVFLVVRMDKCVKLSELKLQRGPGIVVFNHFGKRADNIETTLYIALMIVCHIEDKEIFKIKFLVHINFLLFYGSMVKASIE